MAVGKATAATDTPATASCRSHSRRYSSKFRSPGATRRTSGSLFARDGGFLHQPPSKIATPSRPSAAVNLAVSVVVVSTMMRPNNTSPRALAESALPGYLAIDPAASADAAPINATATTTAAAAIDPAPASNSAPCVSPCARSGLRGEEETQTPPATAATTAAPDHFPMLRRNNRRSSNSLSAVAVFSMDDSLLIRGKVSG